MIARIDKTRIALPNGTTQLLDVKHVNVVSHAQALHFVVDQVGGDTVQFRIYSKTARLRTIAPGDWQGPEYTADWKVDAAPDDWTLQIELLREGQQVDKREYPLRVVPGPIVGPVILPGNLPAGEKDPVPVPVPDTRQDFTWGICGNSTDYPAGLQAAAARMSHDGGDNVRLWHSGWGDLNTVNRALITSLSALGLRIILCVNVKDDDRDANGRPDNFGSPDIAGWVTRNAPWLKKCAFIEAGNELNLAQYRPDDFGGADEWYRPYVDRWLRPLFIALRKIGVKTLCTSVTDSWDDETYSRAATGLIKAGAMDCCDGVCVHAYWLVERLATLAPMLRALRTQYGKDLHVTEANLHPRSVPDTATWRKLAPAYLAALDAGGVKSVSLYRGLPHPKPKVWAAWRSLFGKAGVPNPELYPALLTAVAA